MTDMDKLIEVLTRIAEALEDQSMHQKTLIEASSQARYVMGKTVADLQLSGLIETPEAMKTYSKSLAELSTKVLPFVIKGEWDKALECHTASVEKLVVQLKGLNGKKKDSNKTQYG